MGEGENVIKKKEGRRDGGEKWGRKKTGVCQRQRVKYERDGGEGEKGNIEEDRRIMREGRKGDHVNREMREMGESCRKKGREENRVEDK